jgi:transposase InsO family protein
MILALIDEAVAAGARLSRACAVLHLAPRTVQRWRAQGSQGGHDRRRGPHTTPHNKLSEAERRRVLKVVNSAPYRDLSVKQIVPRLCDQGVYLASESTMYRILKEVGQNAHRQPSKPRTHTRPKQHIATGPSQLLCWDITYLPSSVRGVFFYLHLFLDVWSRKIVGWGVNDVQCGDFAAELLQSVCDDMDVSTDGVVLHADNGKSMKGSSMLSTMQWLGIVPSFSRPNVSDDNPYVEALFRTLKYRPGYASQRFASLADAVAWVDRFVRWYNHEHLHSAIGFVTPHDRHTGADIEILAERRVVYTQAHQRHPERWTRNVRRWKRPRVVKLQPDREAVAITPKQSATSA